MLKTNIAYIGGGSRSWARSLISDLAAQERFCGSVRLYDIDRQAAADNAVIGNRLNASKNAKSYWEYRVSNDLKEALSGAQFVIISILPGTFDEMESDVHAPEKYGVYQAVGDTAGPGGVLRSMRTIPMIEEIANAVKDFCPDAWVINYTNPMTVCVRTLYSVFPKIKALGCCHEVFHTQYILARALDVLDGVKVNSRRDLSTKVCGINHFTFITEAKYRDIDMFGVYDRLVEKCYQTGYNPDGAPEEYKKNCFLCAHRVKMDLYKRYGLIAAAGDRHLAEFCNNAWYLKDRKTVEEWMFHLTPVSWRKEDLRNKIAKTRAIIEEREQFDIFNTGEEGTEIIAALLGLGEIETNVNFPNLGQYENAPLGCVVETDMRISKDMVSPIYSYRMPDNIHALIMRNILNQETIVKAGLKRDKELMFTAFVNEPLCSSLSLSDAKKLFDEMVENTKRYLSSWR